MLMGYMSACRLESYVNSSLPEPSLFVHSFWLKFLLVILLKAWNASVLCVYLSVSVPTT